MSHFHSLLRRCHFHEVLSNRNRQLHMCESRVHADTRAAMRQSVSQSHEERSVGEGKRGNLRFQGVAGVSVELVSDVRAEEQRCKSRVSGLLTYCDKALAEPIWSFVIAPMEDFPALIESIR